MKVLGHTPGSASRSGRVPWWLTTVLCLCLGGVRPGLGQVGSGTGILGKGVFPSRHHMPYLVVMLSADAARLRAGVDYLTRLADFDRFFPDEQASERYLEGLRWPNGFVCPACGHAGVPWASARGLLGSQCRYRASVTAGTIFEGTRKPLKLWFIAAWEIVGHRYGANALNVKRMLGVKSCKTGWSCRGRICRSTTRCSPPAGTPLPSVLWTTT